MDRHVLGVAPVTKPGWTFNCFWCDRSFARNQQERDEHEGRCDERPDREGA